MTTMQSAPTLRRFRARTAAGGERVLTLVKARPAERGGNVAGRHSQHDGNHGGRCGGREGHPELPGAFLFVPSWLAG